MRHFMAEFAKDILNRDIIDKIIDEFIIKNGLVGKVPLTSELKRSRT